MAADKTKRCRYTVNLEPHMEWEKALIDMLESAGASRRQEVLRSILRKGMYAPDIGVSAGVFMPQPAPLLAANGGGAAVTAVPQEAKGVAIPAEPQQPRRSAAALKGLGSAPAAG